VSAAAATVATNMAAAIVPTVMATAIVVMVGVDAGAGKYREEAAIGGAA
jgi:hypothetical protein